MARLPSGGRKEHYSCECFDIEVFDFDIEAFDAAPVYKFVGFMYGLTYEWMFICNDE